MAMYESLGPEHPVWKNRPILEEDSYHYYEAFQMLSGSRPVGFSGPMAIQLSEMESYCRLAMIPSIRRLDFCRILMRIDNKFLECLDKRKTMKLEQPKG